MEALEIVGVVVLWLLQSHLSSYLLRWTQTAQTSEEGEVKERQRSTGRGEGPEQERCPGKLSPRGREKPHKPGREETHTRVFVPLSCCREKKRASLTIRVKTNQMPL